MSPDRQKKTAWIVPAVLLSLAWFAVIRILWGTGGLIPNTATAWWFLC